MFGRVALLFSLLMCAAVPITAQQHRSVVHGTLVDANGQPAAGVRMRVLHEGTGAARRFTSDDSGRFTIPQLEPGVYRIESDDDRHRGFAARVEVTTNDVVEVTLPLAAPTISAAVDVRSFFLPIGRHAPAVRTRFGGSFLADLPLDGRNVLDPAVVVPGMTPGSTGPVGAGSGDGFTGYLLNGFYVTEPLMGSAAVRPQVDSIQDLDVSRASFDASRGRTGGAQVQMTTRGGSNRVSAGAFGFLQTELDRQQFGGFAGGPVVENRTFLFGDYQHTRFSDPYPSRSPGHNLSARLDQIIGEGTRLMATYSLTDGTMLDRRGQHAGVSFTHVPSGSTVNDVRFGVARMAVGPYAIADTQFQDELRSLGFGGGGFAGLTESIAYQLTDTLSWTRGTHLVTAGGEWYAFSRGVDSGELAAHTWSGFVQDDWRPTATLSLSAGARIGRISRQDADVSPKTAVSPRLGAVWTVGEERQVVVRGGYARSQHLDATFTTTPHFDHWHLGTERQWGRNRTMEAAYIGSAGGDLFNAGGTSRYNGVLFEVEQRSDTGINGHLAYTYGRWSTATGAGEPRVRSMFDARHKLTGTFTAWLPIGDERRWFANGLAGKVLKDVQLNGIFAIFTGRPLSPGSSDQSIEHRTLDLALAKNWISPHGQRLQVRVETFNVMNRPTPVPGLFAPEPLDLFGPDNSGRRYQIGVRWVY